MRKGLFIIILVLLSLLRLEAQQELQVNYYKPYIISTEEGKKFVKAWIETNGNDLSISLDGKKIPLLKSEPGRADILLPLIGRETEMKISSLRDKSTRSQLFTPLISSDWGYFGKGKIHIICSSHQDIAWMNTPDSCREERINDIILPALRQTEKNPAFKFEMEQTLNLMELLEAVPSEKQRVIDAYKRGQFTWGATFNQPYEGLESGEQLVRQSYLGRKWIRENLPGMDALAAYNIDVPGRTLQMPQILEKSGIKFLVISRMKEGFYNWYSPDGSKILTYSPGNYGWALLVYKYFEGDVITAFQKMNQVLKNWDEYYRQRNLPPDYGVVISTDAGGPKDYTSIISEWNEIAQSSGYGIPVLKHSTVEDFLHEINVPQAKFDSISGERPDLWLYIHGPAHYEAIKSKKSAAVTLPAAEIFSTVSTFIDKGKSDYPSEKLNSGWYSAIYPDHGWGGKHGDITDSLFRASLEHGNSTGEKILDKSLDAITGNIDLKKPGAIVVFNDLSWTRSGVVRVDISSRKGSGWIVTDSGGKSLPSSVLKEGANIFISFLAENIPSIGYKVFYLKSGKTNPVTDIITGSNFCENRFYRLTLGNGGITGLYDKELKRQVLNTTKYAGGDVLHFGYNGNGAGEFVRITPVNYEGYESLSMKQQQWKLLSSDNVSAVYEASAAMSNFTVIQRITVYHQEKKIDFEYDIPDWPGIHNRQIRAVFPLSMDEAQITYDVPMGIVNVNRDELNMVPRGWSWEGTYRQMPCEIHPREIENFVSSSNSDFGFTMSTNLAVADWIDPGRESVDYPVLQAIMLSSHKSCHYLGNWYHQKGSHKFHFSISSHSPGWQNGYHFGIEGNHPLLTITRDMQQKGILPEETSFVKVSSPLVKITAIKKDKGNNSFIMRLVNVENVDKQTDISLWNPAVKVVKTNLIEEDINDTGQKGSDVRLNVGKNSIETYRIILEE
jgi:alpha-mannosidase